MIDDIDLNKAATIRRCLQRISEGTEMIRAGSMISPFRIPLS
jgi:hypothetical protein